MSNTKQEETPSSSSAPPAPKWHQEMVKVCENIVATRYHDPKAAMRLANELCLKHDNSSLAHFTRGQVIGFYCGDLHDSDKNKKKLLKDTIYSFKRAADMKPELPEYRFNVAQASFQLARLEHENYHVVIQECERALSMDLFSLLSRMNDAKRRHYENMKENLQNLITAAKVGEKEDSRNVMRDMPQPRNVKKQTELMIRKKDRKLELRQEFVKKTGEYWRRLSFREKCRILDVKVKDAEHFYRSGENKKLPALGILTEAVDMYNKKKHWVTWSCCICKEDREKDDYDVWSSLEKHINKHFDDHEPMLKGTDEYKCDGRYDSLEISNGDFILHSVLVERLIIGDSYDDPIPNNKFLSQWLMKESDVKLDLELWEKRRDRTANAASKVFKEIVNLNEKIKVVLEQYEKEKQESAEETQTVLPDQINFLKEKLIYFKREAVCISAYDYREILVPLLKHSIQANLESEAGKQARIEADSVMAELIDEEARQNKSVTAKSKRKKKKDSKRTKVTAKLEVKSEQGSQNSVNGDNLEQDEGIELGPDKQSTPEGELQASIAEDKEAVRPSRDMQRDGAIERFINEDSESQIPASNPQDEQTSTTGTTIFIGSVPVTLKSSKKGSKQEK